MVKKKILVDANNLYEIATSERLPYVDLEFPLSKQLGILPELAVDSQIVFFVGVGFKYKYNVKQQTNFSFPSRFSKSGFITFHKQHES